MKQILEERNDIVFFIKLFPLKTHPAAYRKSKTIVCERSLRLLERAFDGRNIPEPKCETTEVDDNIELAERLGITGTPAIILPDGAVVKGFKEAVKLVEMIETAGRLVEAKEAEASQGVLSDDEAGVEGTGSENGETEVLERYDPAEGEEREHEMSEPETPAYGNGEEEKDDPESP